MREAWTERRAEVDATGASLRDALAAAGGAPADAPPAIDALADAVRAVVAREDREHGGFAAGPSLETPKFPQTPVLRLLQHPALAEVVPEAGAVASRALSAMVASELHDPVDGGFFRYATRRDWSVPHFERMLTDNAGLVEVALAAGDEVAAIDAARFLVDVLQLPSGGIAAAQDSESIVDGRRSEGGYYRATDRAALVPPALDAKVVTGWNGHAIAAPAAGARTDPRFVEAARWAADAVLESNVADDGSLRRASLDEIRSSAAATLEDYGGLARGLLVLAVMTGEAAYAEKARALADLCLADDGIRPPGGGDAVLTAQGMQPTGVPSDGAAPSGPSAFAAAALGLWRLGAGERYRAAAESLVCAAADAALASPLAHGAILEVAVGLAVAPRQIVVVGETDAALADAARRTTADVVAVVSPAQAQAFAEAGSRCSRARPRRRAKPPPTTAGPSPAACRRRIPPRWGEGGAAAWCESASNASRHAGRFRAGELSSRGQRLRPRRHFLKETCVYARRSLILQALSGPSRFAARRVEICILRCCRDRPPVLGSAERFLVDFFLWGRRFLPGAIPTNGWHSCSRPSLPT